MTQVEQQKFDDFVAGLKARGFTDYLIRRYGPNADCNYHQDNWEGRYLLLEGSVTLEIAGKFRSFSAGDTDEMQPQTLHREVFGPAREMGVAPGFAGIVRGLAVFSSQ